MDWKLNSTPIWPQKELSSTTKSQDTIPIIDNKQKIRDGFFGDKKMWITSKKNLSTKKLKLKKIYPSLLFFDQPKKKKFYKKKYIGIGATIRIVKRFFIFSVFFFFIYKYKKGYF